MRPTRGTWLLVCLVSTFGTASCDSDDQLGPCGSKPCSSDCDSLPTGKCDALQANCLRRIFSAVACVRGTPGEVPEVRKLTAAEYRTELENQAAATAGAQTRDAGTVDEDDAGQDDPKAGAETATNDAVSPWYRALGLLGLLSNASDTRASAIDAAVKNTAAFYDSSRHRITLIDRGRPLDDPDIQYTIAHELVHALQDQDVGLYELDGRVSTSVDGSLAYGCLIEGEAELYAELAFDLLQGLSPDTGVWQQNLDADLRSTRSDIASSSSPYFVVWLLRYPIGTRYLLDTWLHGGNWAVQSQVEAPPLSTIQFVVGFDAERSRREHWLQPLACDRAAMPAGYEFYSNSDMGPLELYALLGHVLVERGVLDRGVSWAEATAAQWHAVKHWRQDAMTVLVNARGRVAVSYRVRFDDAAHASSVSSFVRRTSDRFAVHRHGDEIELLAAEDAQVLEGWATDPDECPAPD